MPPGVHVEIPLQAYFRINTENMGQFERTLIIADEGSYVHYIEGCTAPIYKSDSLHSAVVEIIVKKNARVRYTTIQNWSNNVYNLVTKRAIAHEGATMEWIDGNIGSKVTMKYPSIFLVGRARQGRDPLGRLRRSRSAPGRRREDDPHGAVHAVVDRLQVDRPRRWPRRLPRRGPGRRQRPPLGQHGSLRRAAGRHDLALRHVSRRSTSASTTCSSATRPRSRRSARSSCSTCSRRGMPEDEAMAMIVRGFIEPIARELPMEYALELNKLIEMGMEGSVG